MLPGERDHQIVKAVKAVENAGVKADMIRTSLVRIEVAHLSPTQDLQTPQGSLNKDAPNSGKKRPPGVVTTQCSYRADTLFTQPGQLRQHDGLTTAALFEQGGRFSRRRVGQTVLPIELHKLGGQFVQRNGARRSQIMGLAAALNRDICNPVEQGALVSGNKIALGKNALQISNKGELLLRGGVHIRPR